MKSISNNSDSYYDESSNSNNNAFGFLESKITKAKKEN